MIKNIFKIAMISSLGLGIVGCSSLPQEDWNKYNDDSYKYQKVENQVVQENNMPPISIELNEDDTLIQADWETLLAQYKNTPKYLWENCTQVHIKSQETISQEGPLNGGCSAISNISENSDFSDLDITEVVGVTGWVSGNEIYVFPGTQGNEERYNNGEISIEWEDADGNTITRPDSIGEDYEISMSKEEDKNSYDPYIIHELWHIYDSANNISSTSTFLDLYNNAPNSLGEIYATNVSEFFAGAGEMYMCFPDELEEKNLDIYNFFANRFAK